MDSIALVEDQIKAGQKLIERLNAEGIPVPAAAWVNETEGFQWQLYLVTPLVGEDRAVRPAYRRILPVARQLQAEGTWIDPFELKVVGPTNPIGKAIAEFQPHQPGRPATRYYGSSLGGLSIEAAYIYAPLPAAAE